MTKAFGQTGKCVWQLDFAVYEAGKPWPKPGYEVNGAKYCGKPTKYVMAKDDDGVQYRKYDHLCPEHRVKADAIPDEDE